jgi:hypothetical protein
MDSAKLSSLPAVRSVKIAAARSYKVEFLSNTGKHRALFLTVRPVVNLETGQSRIDQIRKLFPKVAHRQRMSQNRYSTGSGDQPYRLTGIEWYARRESRLAPSQPGSKRIVDRLNHAKLNQRSPDVRTAHRSTSGLSLDIFRGNRYSMLAQPLDDPSNSHVSVSPKPLKRVLQRWVTGIDAIAQEVEISAFGRGCAEFDARHYVHPRRLCRRLDRFGQSVGAVVVRDAEDVDAQFRRGTHRLCWCERSIGGSGMHMEVNSDQCASSSVCAVRCKRPGVTSLGLAPHKKRARLVRSPAWTR